MHKYSTKELKFSNLHQNLLGFNKMHVEILRKLYMRVSYNETHIKHMYIIMTLCNQNQSQKFIAFVHDISSVQNTGEFLYRHYDLEWHFTSLAVS